MRKRLLLVFVFILASVISIGFVLPVFWPTAQVQSKIDTSVPDFNLVFPIRASIQPSFDESIELDVPGQQLDEFPFEFPSDRFCRIDIDFPKELRDFMLGFTGLDPFKDLEFEANFVGPEFDEVPLALNGLRTFKVNDRGHEIHWSQRINGVVNDRLVVEGSFFVQSNEKKFEVPIEISFEEVDRLDRSPQKSWPIYRAEAYWGPPREIDELPELSVGSQSMLRHPPAFSISLVVDFSSTKSINSTSQPQLSTRSPTTTSLFA